MFISTRENLAIQDLDIEDHTMLLVFDRHGELAETTLTQARQACSCGNGFRGTDRASRHSFTVGCGPGDLVTVAWLVLERVAKRHTMRTAGSNSYGYLLDYQVCTDCGHCSEEEDRPCAPDVQALLDHVTYRARYGRVDSEHVIVREGLDGVSCRCGKLCNSMTHFREHRDYAAAMDAAGRQLAAVVA